MRVKFYPRDIGMFRNGDFDFVPSITLEARSIFNYKVFNDRAELIEYLKSCGVTLNDHNYPLKFVLEENSVLGRPKYKVHQWTHLGLMEEL